MKYLSLLALVTDEELIRCSMLEPPLSKTELDSDDTVLTGWGTKVKVESEK